MLGDSNIADSAEILELLTAIMRGQLAGVKLSDRLKAVELMGKVYDMYTVGGFSNGGDAVVIINDLGDCDDVASK